MRKSAIVLGALLTSTALASPALAQDATPPPRKFVDQNGVNLASGTMDLGDEAVSIGTASQGLVFLREPQNAFNTFSYTVIGGDLNSVVMLAGQQRIDFDLVGGVYANKQGTGETLTKSGNSWTFTARDGTVAQMDLSQISGTIDNYKYIGVTQAIANTVTFPNGEKWTLTYKFVTKDQQGDITANIRLQSAQSANGYMAKFEYETNTFNFFRQLTKVTLINSAVDYCSPSADTCTGLTQSWPSLTFTRTTGTPVYKTTADSLGRTTRYTYTSNQLTAIRRPTSSSADNTTIAYGLDGRV